MDPRPATIRDLEPSDLAVLHAFVEEHFGGGPIVTPTDVYRLEQLSCLTATLGKETAGFGCYHCNGGVYDIVVLGSLVEGKGIGTALIAALLERALEHRYTHLRAYTTNDNEKALHFYQSKGFAIAATHHDAMDKVRRYKPQLPAIGLNGLPLRDMIELKMAVTMKGSLAQNLPD